MYRHGSASPVRLLAGVLLAMALAALAPGAPAQAVPLPKPRPLSPAERAGVELVAELLAGGPRAWWPRLAADSPLRILGEHNAADAIALRTGPTTEAIWQLQTHGPTFGPGIALFTVEHPSGAEDAVALELVEEAGEWRLRTVRSLIDADAWPRLPDRPPADKDPGQPADPYDTDADSPDSSDGGWWGGVGETGGQSGPPGGWPLATAFAAVALLAAVAGTRREALARRAPRTVAALLAVIVVVFACRREEAPAARTAAGGGAPADPLAALLPLRLALAGNGEEAIEKLFAAAPPQGLASRVARLWKADLRLRQLRLDEAQELLDEPAWELPLGDLLQARLAFLRGDEAEALATYRYALQRGLDYDDVRFEIAEAHFLLGYPYEGDAVLRAMAEGGSRLPDVYYLLAEVACQVSLQDDAALLFDRAWHLRPIERRQILAAPGLARLSNREEIYPLLEVSAAREPAVPPPHGDRLVIALPPGSETAVSGAHFWIHIGKNRLEVPGGALLAAATTPIDDAGRAARREEQAALDHLDKWVRLGAASALGQPSQRRQLERLAAVLASQGRWAELLQVTAGIAERLDQTPPGLVTLRAGALVSLHREREALDLLIALARSERAGRRRDPAVLYSLAEVLASREQYDLALRVLERARALSPVIPESRLRQVEMQKELAGDGTSLTVGRFSIRYPPVADEQFVRALGEVLERERRRLQRWIPGPTGPAPKPIGVDLFPLRDFLASYSSDDVAVIGIFDGRLRLPLADVPSLEPRIVAILSHELAHALIAEATHDLAPKWLHEGLAQHVELAEVKANPIPSLAAKDGLLSLEVVEAALQGFSEPHFVGQAYDQAEWTVEFLERRSGVDGVHRLLASFGNGQTTEQALAAAYGLTVGDLDDELRQWGLGDAPRVVRASNLPRYELQLAEDTGAGADTRLPQPGKGTLPSAFAFPAATPAARQVSAAEALAWQQRYDRAMGPLRPNLLAVLRALNSGAPDDSLREACADLGHDLRDAMADPDVFQGPLPEMEQVLTSLYAWLVSMTNSCSKGDWTSAETHRGRAEDLMVVAGKLLRSQGMHP